MKIKSLFDVFFKFHQKFNLFKRVLLILIDIIICNTSIFFAMYLRLGFFYPILEISHVFLFLSSFLLIVILISFDIYKSLNRYSGWDSFIQLGKALLVYDILFFAIYTLISVSEIPRTIGIIHPMIVTSMVLSSRIFIRIMLGNKFKNNESKKQNILIYGAGAAGRQLANTIQYSKKLSLVGFLEDKKKLIGNKINNKLIFDSKKLKVLKHKYNINTIFLAIPSLNRSEKNIILNNIQKHKIAVKTLPTLFELENNNISYNDLRPLNIEELLARKPVDITLKSENNYVYEKVVLITGAGGSIGSELCKQVLIQNPSKLVILDTSEYNLYKIHQELIDKYLNINIVPILGSVTNLEAMETLFANCKPEIVYHAAAYKHVPLVQSNPIEGLRNNVFGTKIIADLSIRYNIEKFILISSDKAVRPTNIMGASKRLAELYLQSLNPISTNTIFTMVRFGNVLGSSGSVIPKFHRQILSNNPITLTHKNIYRFFMTAKEAIHLIIEAGNLAEGGEVFILDMGKSVKIMDLAKKMIFLSGKTLKDKTNPNGDVEIIITGLRPGEKLYEEVLIGKNPIPTKNKKIFKANEVFYDNNIIRKNLKSLNINMKNYNLKEIDKCLRKLIEGYKNESIINK